MKRQVLIWTCQACGASGDVYAMGSSSFRDLNDAVGFAIRFHRRQDPECPGPVNFPIEPEEWVAAA